MKYLLLILFFISCSAAKKTARVYDSTFIKRDTISVKVYKDSAAGRFDTVKFHKQEIEIIHSPNFFKTKNGAFYVAVSALLLLIVALIKYK